MDEYKATRAVWELSEWHFRMATQLAHRIAAHLADGSRSILAAVYAADRWELHDEWRRLAERAAVNPAPVVTFAVGDA